MLLPPELGVLWVLVGVFFLFPTLTELCRHELHQGAQTQLLGTSLRPQGLPCPQSVEASLEKHGGLLYYLCIILFNFFTLFYYYFEAGPKSAWKNYHPTFLLPQPSVPVLPQLWWGGGRRRFPPCLPLCLLILLLFHLQVIAENQ